MPITRVKVEKLPRYIRSGKPALFMDQKLAAKRDELALSAVLICDRNLFGYVYQEIQPEYFWRMPQNSGVLVCQCARTSAIFPGRNNPGDVDLLIIPYEGKEVLLDRIVAIELKIIRASYRNQGRSPNDYGYSQALHLIELGFPHVAVIHMIISDESPPEAWKEMLGCTVLDSSGRVSEPKPVLVDTMPMMLIDRALGRLLANSPNSELGLVSAYMGRWREEGRSILPSNGRWFPSGRPAQLNSKSDIEAMMKVYRFYGDNIMSFIRIPRFDPIEEMS